MTFLLYSFLQDAHSFLRFYIRFFIRLWLPSRMSFRIRFIHEQHLRIEQLIWVRLAYEMHAGFHPVWVHCLEIS